MWPVIGWEADSVAGASLWPPYSTGELPVSKSSGEFGGSCGTLPRDVGATGTSSAPHVEAEPGNGSVFLDDKYLTATILRVVASKAFPRCAQEY